VRLAAISMDAAEIQRLISTFLNSAQREVENAKPWLQAYLTLGTQVDEQERRAQEMKLLLERRTRQINLLNELDDLLLSCHNSREAYDVIQQQAQQILPVKVGALYISTAKDGISVLKREAVWGECLLAVPEFAPEDCWAWRRNRIYRVRDVARGMLCKHLQYSPANGYLCVPMMAQGRTLGVVHLVLADGDHSGAEGEQLSTFLGEHIALALANLMKQENLIHQAMHDHLTGLYNRRFMEETLKIRLNDASRYKRSLGVLWFDIDHFKDFNTRFNAAGGDAVLKDVGRLLMRSIRGHDIPCRYGGDEFVLIMPEADERIIKDRAQHLCEEIKRRQVFFQGQVLGPVTVSVGVAVFPGLRLSGEQLLTAAEELLHAAEAASKRSKERGGDWVTPAETLSENLW
jgi:diguanylate cyclase (GGDEF)-like protein